MDPRSLLEAQAPKLCVLKFGSSVLGVETDYPAAALEVYRHVREGEKVVAVVSALAGETDALLGQGERVGGAGSNPALLARVARVRSEARRVGEECVRPFWTRLLPDH